MTGIPSNFDVIQRQLSETSLRHAVASHNIANINTPGFVANEVVSFETSLSEAGGRKIKVRAQSDTATRLDGNNVDIDKEIGQLTKNSLVHNAYTQILAAKIRQMQSAISGR